jgi:hypothetical protein
MRGNRKLRKLPWQTKILQVPRTLDSRCLAENPRVKRFISEAEQDYRSTPEVTAATPLSDLPKENAKSSRWSMFHGVTRAGAAMGSFARSSYKCLRSLFRNCSRKTQE